MFFLNYTVVAPDSSPHSSGTSVLEKEDCKVTFSLADCRLLISEEGKLVNGAMLVGRVVVEWHRCPSRWLYNSA